MHSIHKVLQAVGSCKLLGLPTRHTRGSMNGIGQGNAPALLACIVPFLCCLSWIHCCCRCLPKTQWMTWNQQSTHCILTVGENPIVTNIHHSARADCCVCMLLCLCAVVPDGSVDHFQDSVDSDPESSVLLASITGQKKGLHALVRYCVQHLVYLYSITLRSYVALSGGLQRWYRMLTVDALCY